MESKATAGDGRFFNAYKNLWESRVVVASQGIHAAGQGGWWVFQTRPLKDLWLILPCPAIGPLIVVPLATSD